MSVLLWKKKFGFVDPILTANGKRCVVVNVPWDRHHYFQAFLNHVLNKQSKPRSTSAMSEKRAESEAKRQEEEDKIKDFNDFCQKMSVRFSKFIVIAGDVGKDVYLSKTDTRRQKVIRFLNLLIHHFTFWFPAFCNWRKRWNNCT